MKGPTAPDTNDDGADAPTFEEKRMAEIEWLKPGVIAGSIVYALLGVAVFWISFLVVDLVTPYKLWEEIVRKRNLPLAIVVAAMCIAIGLIVASAIRG
jgi:putative membrane protein